MAVPAFLVFCLAIPLMGSFANPHVFEPKPVRSASGALSAAPADFGVAARGGLEHWRTIAFFATHVPEVCWGDNAINDFQKRQCADFWNRLEAGIGLGLLPFGLALAFLVLMRSHVKGFYRKARKRVETAKPVQRGVVTDPATAPLDVWSWSSGLRPIAVQLASGQQLKVYMDPYAPLPRPGQKVVIFDGISGLGAKRPIAVLYTPHIAVVAAT